MRRAEQGQFLQVGLLFFLQGCLLAGCVVVVLAFGVFISKER